MIDFMARDFIFMLTTISLKASFKKDPKKAEVFMSIVMEPLMKENGMAIKKMEMVPTFTPIKIFIQEDGSMDKNMATEFMNIKTGISMMVNGSKIKRMVPEFCTTKLGPVTMVNGSMIKPVTTELSPM